jgi:hypothetical protein
MSLKFLGKDPNSIQGNRRLFTSTRIVIATSVDPQRLAQLEVPEHETVIEFPPASDAVSPEAKGVVQGLTLEDLVRGCERSAVHLEMRDGCMRFEPMFTAWQAGHRDDPADRASWWDPW